ncbi:glycoside hydrolase family 127 protein [Sporolactobacillus shoreicorticis]|uniref:Glycoside hydrolase family 127 protein n=1 Tax=Sporolactobacillus shoreicorticis TaxID=1923877 RepID=A0ABW5S058_9BACL|nr:beta-L-arabinofuranosidase domain-containing protein [Sporolactobacillus shoreicorticis]MCO7124653.1 glycoside hydrolase family 127 protein [Sporolactobacillus shoreicorticis]
MKELTKLQLAYVQITSNFWKRYRDLIAQDAVPFQWDMINDKGKMDITNAAAAGGAADRSGAIANLKIAAGRMNGHHFGYPFQDTDVYKWLETVAYVLKYHPDDKLKTEADWTVDLIADAQDDDGYLSTYFQIEAPERKFKRLQQSHELYSMGHYIEAGVAYHKATGNKTALHVAEKMAACINSHFGSEAGKIHGYDGHPEIELALAQLYETTQNADYLKLAKYFVTERGRDLDFFDRQNEADGLDNDFFPELRTIGERYYFADKPITEQEDAHGHAVRVLYFCTGLAHVARVEKDQKLLDAANRLWNDIVKKQMYVTGNVGQTVTGEAFTYDYDLPNDTDYSETCASVSMAFFTKQLLANDFQGKFGDVIEKEIFNGALSGMALDGKHYFYANPLEADPTASELNPGKKHIATRRSSWFACACCPANITRLIASLDQYLYEVRDNTILSHQFIANDAKFNNGIEIKQSGNFPWDGHISYQITNPSERELTFGIRIPAWSLDHYSVEVDGSKVNTTLNNDILYLTIENGNTDISLNLNMQPHLVHANTRVSVDALKVAVQRGPIVYCVEGVDNEEPLWLYVLDQKPSFTYDYQPKLLDGVEILTTDDVFRLKIDSEEDSLYTFDQPRGADKSSLTFIPYYAWANRYEKQMTVWLNQRTF